MACIRTAAGYCAAEWTQTTGNPFSTSGGMVEYCDQISNVLYVINYYADANAAASSLTGTACRTDYVIIPNAALSPGGALTTDRFCGNTFPTVQSKFKILNRQIDHQLLFILKLQCNLSRWEW
jgi:hypothetical protein